MKKNKKLGLSFVTLLFGFISMAQNFPPIDKTIKFEKADFTPIEKLLEDGLPNKAISQLLSIQEKAIQQKNYYNLNQSLERIGESIYSAGLELNELQLLYFRLHEQLTVVNGPMQNIIASNLEEWFQNIQYRNVFSFDEESLEWTVKGEKIRLKNGDASPLNREYHRLLLANEKELMAIASEQIYDTTGWEYKPTLYDVLAEKYLSTNVAEQVNDSCHWQSTLEFSSENLSLENRVYANLEQLHQTNQRWETYAYWLEKRITNCDESQRTSANLLAVYAKFQKELIGFPASNRFAYRQAQIHANAASQFDWRTRTSDEHGFEVALRIIEEAFSVHTKSDFNDELEDLKNQILSPSLELMLDQDMRPAEHNFMKVKFRNLASAEMVIYKIVERLPNWEYSENPIQKLKLKEIKINQLKLHDDSKHLFHEKDFLLDELSETGQYLILAGTTWQDCEKALKADKLYEVKNIAYEIVSLTSLVVRKSNEKDGLRLLINDIETGKPIKNAKVTTESTNEKGLRKVYKTDKNGSVKIEGRGHSKVTISHKGDSISDYLYYYPNNSYLPTQKRVFTDRSLYRPGQVVFYKTLCIQEKESNYTTDFGQSTKIVFKDQNDQTLYENTSTTNEYGSTSGSFVLPKSGMPLGGISVIVDNQYVAHLQVEEYKRPTFLISFEAPKEKIVLGQPVQMEGKVTAFAGYPIVNAEVEVNISEIRYFPRWCIVLDEYRRYDTTLLVKTDSKGIFKIEFEPNNPKETYGVFYAFDAKVVDLTGETQTANYSMFIGKSALNISANVQEKYRVDEEAKITCLVENSQGIKQEGNRIEYEIRKKEEGIWYRDFREEAEFQNFSEKNLKEWKPELAYYSKDKEAHYSTLQKGEIASGGELDLKALLNGSAGEFELYFSLKDELGDSAELLKKIIVWNPDSKKAQHQEEFWAEVINSQPNLGDEVNIYIGTSHKKAKLLIATYDQNGLISLQYKKIKQRKILTFKMEEKLSNGISVYTSLIKRGKISERNSQLYPLDTTRLLKMKLKSIQEPLRPGSELTWMMEVFQNGSKVLNAEMLASMYDASLDEIIGHSWQQDLTPRKFIYTNWSTTYTHVILNQGTTWDNPYFELPVFRPMYRDYGGFETSPMMMKADAEISKVPAPAPAMEKDNGISEVESAAENSRTDQKNNTTKIRENFNETAFFFPQIHADEEGNYKWTFTLPDALTRWKMMSLVHTQDVKNAFFTQSFEARKELMLETFEPRFWRKGDSLIWVGKVTNLSEKEQKVEVKLKFTNPNNEENISSIFGDFPTKQISLAANESKAVEWSLFVPENAPLLVTFEAEASTADFADIVRKPTPILSGTETITMAENFTFDEKGTYELKLRDLEKISNEAKLIAYSIQIQPQPLWSTLISLAKLMEPTNELTESYFNQFFATQLAQKILKENPEMKQALKTWQLADEDALTSLLEQNEELKNLLLSETVWFEDAKSESQSLRRLSQLLDNENLIQVSNESWNQVKKLQLEDGSWSWIGKERASWYTTQYIANGLAWLKETQVPVDDELFLKALNALDLYHHQEFARLTKTDKAKEYGLNPFVIQWLYIRSFGNNVEDSATKYYAALIPKQWKNYSLSTQAIMGLWSLRKKNVDFTNKLKAFLNDRVRKDAKMGMYWLENLCGYGWFENNIETHAMLIQFLEKAGQDTKAIQAMQMWLLQQKRTQMWETPKSTVMACYALQSFGNETTKSQKVTLQLPNEAVIVVPNEKVVFTHAPSDQNWTNVKKNAVIELSTNAPVFANMQVTYTDKARNIQKTTGDFRVERNYYRVKNGEEISISPKDEMQVGDVIRVKIKLVSDRNLDFVYIEDPKAPGWEPMNALSGYQYADEMYYLSNRDSKTEFFIENVNKGTHLYVYELKITAKGVFQVGPSKAMCYYAPTFVANTQGKEMKVK